MAISLYAPHVAKLLAYADCSITMLTNSDPRLCDCNRIVDNEDIPVGADQPNKQKDISIKADWKYIGELAYRFSNQVDLFEKHTALQNNSFIPEKFPRSIFHPPQA